MRSFHSRLRELAKMFNPKEDKSGSKKMRSHTKKGPGRMPFRRTPRAAR